MAESALALPMQPGSTCERRWRAQLEALLALDERSLPSSDDEPMADSDTQLWPLTYSIHAIAARFADREDVYVSGDLFVHYVARTEAGMPVRGQIAPDVLVVFGVEDRVRDSYVVWREGRVPDFVMEISSNRSWRRDRIEKRTIYEAMGVAEYFIHDPRERFRPPRLVGLRLQSGRYREIPFETMPNGKRGIRSATLNLYARVDGGGRLRLVRSDERAVPAHLRGGNETPCRRGGSPAGCRGATAGGRSGSGPVARAASAASGQRLSRLAATWWGRPWRSPALGSLVESSTRDSRTLRYPRVTKFTA